MGASPSLGPWNRSEYLSADNLTDIGPWDAITAGADGTAAVRLEGDDADVMLHMVKGVIYPARVVRFQDAVLVPASLTADVGADDIKLTALGEGDDGNSLTFAIVDAGVKASKLMNPAGAKNALLWTSKRTGTLDNNISVVYVDPGGTTATLAITVDGYAITVSLGRAASAINSTAAQIKTAVEAHAVANSLVALTFDAADAANDGTGVVTALAVQNLAGGTAPALDVTVTGGVHIVVQPAVNEDGTIKSTSAEVAAAVNADAEAGLLVVAEALTGGDATVHTLAETAFVAGTTTASTLANVQVFGTA